MVVWVRRYSDDKIYTMHSLLITTLVYIGFSLWLPTCKTLYNPLHLWWQSQQWWLCVVGFTFKWAVGHIGEFQVACPGDIQWISGCLSWRHTANFWLPVLVACPGDIQVACPGDIQWISGCLSWRHTLNFWLPVLETHRLPVLKTYRLLVLDT